MSDREIVAALLARDRDITETYFYRKCYPLFKACFDNYYTDCETCIEFINEIYLYLMLPNPATQRSYMQNFSFRCSLINWLKIVAQTYCHQLFKKKGAFFEDSLDDGDRFTPIADSLSEKATDCDRSDLELALQMMPNVRYRELIRLKYLEGCSNEETAERLGMTMDNFYNKHLLAKKQFITALKKEGLASVIGCGDVFDAHINIPPVVMHNGEEYQVTVIEKEAFQRAYLIITINLPKNVTRIGKRAFDGCISLVSITIPDEVTDIEKQTFRKCTSLVSVVFPSHLKHIHTMAFALCKGLTSLTLPDGLRRIGYDAFGNCSNLSEVHIPDSVKRIGLMAFWMTSTPLGKKNHTRDMMIMLAIWWIPIIALILYVYYKCFM